MRERSNLVSKPLSSISSPICFLTTTSTSNYILFLSLQPIKSAVTEVQGILDDLLWSRCNPLTKSHVYTSSANLSTIGDRTSSYEPVN